MKETAIQFGSLNRIDIENLLNPANEDDSREGVDMNLLCILFVSMFSHKWENG